MAALSALQRAAQDAVAAALQAPGVGVAGTLTVTAPRAQDRVTDLPSAPVTSDYAIRASVGPERQKLVDGVPTTGCRVVIAAKGLAATVAVGAALTLPHPQTGELTVYRVAEVKARSAAAITCEVTR